jgi:hypothetical protein
MPKKNNKKKKSVTTTAGDWKVPEEVNNVLPSSTPGVYMWHGDSVGANWMIGRPERFRRSNFGFLLGDPVPDLSVDPADNLLTVLNATSNPRSFHITIENQVLGKCDEPLIMGSNRDESDVVKPCVALVLLVPPKTSVDVCRVCTDEGGSLNVSSDVLDWVRHPCPDDMSVSFCFSWFPLGDANEKFLVTQGCGGGLTHFSHPSTFHAIDFECPVGTSVRAVSDGVVVDVRQRCTCSGIKVSNLFDWNSITLKCTLKKDDRPPSVEASVSENDCGHPLNVFIEYVHIQVNEQKSPFTSFSNFSFFRFQALSAQVSVGEHVKAGQLLCFSGDAGFCPLPHLHIEAHLSEDPGAPSIPLRWTIPSGEIVTPEVGQWYGGFDADSVSKS